MPASDRRAEPRHPGAGPLTLTFEDPAPREITGSLTDCSASGFRAVHAYPALPTGQIVRFQHAMGSGEARVMWNRILDSRVETGFFVLTP